MMRGRRSERRTRDIGSSNSNNDCSDNSNNNSNGDADSGNGDSNDDESIGNTGGCNSDSSRKNYNKPKPAAEKAVSAVNAALSLKQWAVTYMFAETEDLRPQRWRTSNNQQETRADKWDMESNGLHRPWAREDSVTDTEEGLLVMMITTIRLDGLSRPCSFVRWMGTFLAYGANLASVTV